jgi:hypothetical protein
MEGGGLLPRRSLGRPECPSLDLVPQPERAPKTSFGAKIPTRQFCARSGEDDNWVTNNIAFEQR